MRTIFGYTGKPMTAGLNNSYIDESRSRRIYRCLHATCLLFLDKCHATEYSFAAHRLKHRAYFVGPYPHIYICASLICAYPSAGVDPPKGKITWGFRRQWARGSCGSNQFWADFLVPKYLTASGLAWYYNGHELDGGWSGDTYGQFAEGYVRISQTQFSRRPRHLIAENAGHHELWTTSLQPQKLLASPSKSCSKKIELENEV